MKASTGKILMLLENCSFQTDKRVKREAGALVRAGYRVSVISPQPPDGYEVSVLSGVQLYQYPAPPDGSSFMSYLWEYAYAMIASFVLSLVVLLREGFDIIHAHNPPDTFALIAAPYKALGKRFVYDHHDLAPEMYFARFGNRGHRLVYHVLVLLERFSCRLADRIITANESYKAMEIERHQVSEKRISVVRNAPDLEILRPTEPQVDLCQRAGTILVYAGNMAPQDGVDYLLRALHHLIQDLGRTDFLCVLVGTGGAWLSLKSMAERMELAKYVWFTGWVPHTEVAHYLEAADICVAPEPSNPYNDRSTMIKIMEYMALGKPTVAFDLPEHRVTAGDAAVYARPNDELDFARQIAALMDDPELRKRLGRTGIERVETELAWEHQEKRLLEVYETLSRG